MLTKKTLNRSQMASRIQTLISYSRTNDRDLKRNPGVFGPTSTQEPNVICSFLHRDRGAAKDLTGLEELAHPQEAERDSHDGRLVQMGGHPARQRQRVGQLVEHLRLLTAPVSGGIAGAQFPLLRTAPAPRGRERQGKHACTNSRSQPEGRSRTAMQCQSQVSVTSVFL